MGAERSASVKRTYSPRDRELPFYGETLSMFGLFRMRRKSGKLHAADRGRFRRAEPSSTTITSALQGMRFRNVSIFGEFRRSGPLHCRPERRWKPLAEPKGRQAPRAPPAEVSDVAIKRRIVSYAISRTLMGVERVVQYMSQFGDV